MSKVAPIQQRKDDHIKINLEQNVRSGISTGLEAYRFTHQALPELNLDEVDTRLSLFGKPLQAPLLISSMTGGTADANAINLRLARAAQECGLAMGVGSQRAALEKPELAPTFQVRSVAPDILLFANLGAVQLNYGYGAEQCLRAVEMIEADALYLHLNPLQEAVQHGGDVNWKGLAAKIEQVCKTLPVPVIAKEVGWGISQETARLLANCGIAAIDVAGAGGTSWSQVEMYRAPDDFLRKLAGTFISWGIPTADSILAVQTAAPGLPIFASGGLQDGLDVAKSLALGATLGGMAGAFLQAASISTDEAIELMRLTVRQLQISMFAAGAGNLAALREGKLIQNGTG
jgi:isopentenyl-diphosphate delta-isomerase